MKATVIDCAQQGDPPFPFGRFLVVDEHGNNLDGFDSRTLADEAAERRNHDDKLSTSSDNVSTA